MGTRRSSHQHDDESGQLVPYNASTELLASPLLPYEKELIRTLGCSEEEYRRHVKAVTFLGRSRPAGYEAIPDIRCDPVTIVVTLAIGLALSAAASLLRPAVEKPEASNDKAGQRKNKSIRLASRQGSERFGATSGFDTIADVANYAEPIAVLFAKREDDIGGVLSGGQLVWSRAFSYGNEQGVKLMFIIGEQGLGEGIDRPDLEGIFLGTVGLDAVYKNKYAFYWNRNTRINGRIQAKNFAYGTRATPDAGDPQTNNDILLAPSILTPNDTAFSQSYTPSSNAEFGCYAGVANGTSYRVNFELVPLPKSRTTDGENTENGEEYRERLSTSARNRAKISGTYGKPPNATQLQRLGQKGVGREYGRRMGLRFLNGQEVAPGGPNGHRVTRPVSIGDRATYIIGGNVLPEDRYWEGDNRNDVNVDDINNTTLRMREEADDLMQVGQIVMIARTLWVVKSRKLDVWGLNVSGPFTQREEQSIDLECIDTFADDEFGRQVGFVSSDVITRGIFTDDQGGGTYDYEGASQNNGLTVGPGYYPIMRVGLGLIRNTRPCESTEFGLKSQVWNRASGLCNFSPLPDPESLIKADSRGDSINSGTMSLYFNRTSVFTIWLRPAGVDENNKEYRWRPLGEQFAIRGSRPIDQYNFLRLIHPEIREYEYKFLPKNGADLTQFSPDEAEFWLLDARLTDWQTQGATLSRTADTDYGTFVIQAAGRIVRKGDIEFCPELATGVESNEITPIFKDVPSAIIISELFPDLEDDDTVATSVVQVGDGYSSVPGGTQYRQSALFYELFGQSSSFGLTRSATRRFDGLRGGRWLELKFDGVVNAFFPIDHPYFPGYRAWNLTKITVVSSSGGMNLGDTFNCRVPARPFPQNPRNPANYSQVGVEIKVNDTNGFSGPGGRENGYSYEVLGDARDYSTGTIRKQEITLSSGSKTTVIEYQATVVNSPPEIVQEFGVNKVYDTERVSVVPNSSTGDWSTGINISDIRTVSSSNPFRPAGSEVGVCYQVSATTLVEVDGTLVADRIFEQNAQITDISNYAERTTSNTSSAEHNIVYVTETLKSREYSVNYDKLTSCALAIRSGREFSRIDQLRVWLKTGVEVTRFLPSERGSIGPSNLLPDLVYYLMTDPTAGMGKTFSDKLIDLDSFSSTCTFLKTNKLFFNGAITEPENLRNYITGIAPYFLLDFSITDGRFSFIPAIPTTSSGNISLSAVPISALFTDGNIIEGTFEAQYLEADQRRNFIALMRWRYEQVNKLPTERTVSIRFAEAGSQDYPIESFDMTDYCCSEEHAVVAAKYLLSLRRRVTHNIAFKTTPLGLNLAPGNYIKVVTQVSPYQAANNGIIEADGTLVMTTAITDNVYPIWYFDRAQDTTVEGNMTVVNGKVQEEQLWDTIVTLRYPGISTSIYQVQELTLEDDGLVKILALEHPTDASGISQIAKDLIKGSGNFVRGY